MDKEELMELVGRSSMFRPVPKKALTSAEIEEQTKAFLKQGNKIEKVKLDKKAQHRVAAGLLSSKEDFIDEIAGYQSSE